MKILFAHNRYLHAGGEDTVVTAEIRLLRENGHEVHLWLLDNKDLPSGLLGKLNTALNSSYSSAARAQAREQIRLFKPDVVHVHNFFPQISPSVYDACADEQVPVVQTLHNYRLICPGALLMRDGKICELCVTGSPYQAVRYGCYRGSTTGSLAVAHLVAQHRKQQTWSNKVSRFIALTDFAKSKFVQAGFPEHKITVKPNFSNSQAEAPSATHADTEPYALFVGRLSQEKGLNTLVQAWQKLDRKITLKVAGSGDLLPTLQNHSAIEPLGFQPPESIAALMQNAAFLLMPSECYETFGMALIEAFSYGLPVIASALGSMAEIVKNGETGLLFEPGNPDDLATKIRWLIDNPDESRRMGHNARQAYLAHYTAEHNLHQLLAIYQQAIGVESVGT